MGKLDALRSRSKHLAVMAMVALLAVLVAACGGGGDSSSSSAESSNASADVTSSAADEKGSESSTLTAMVEEAEQEPGFPITQALPKKPPPGETIICLKNDVAQVQTICDGAREATEAVNWNYEDRSYQSADTSGLLVLMKEVLQKKPYAVIVTGTPEEIWKPLMPAYEKAGVNLVPMYVGPAKIEGPVIGNVAGYSTNEWAANALAAWFITESGESGKAILQAVPGFPAITLWQKYFDEMVAEECQACATESVEVSLEEIASGAAVRTLVSALQSDPSIEYAFSYNTNFVPGISNELTNAGLSNVKVGGWAGTSEGIADILKGEDYAWILANLQYSGWLGVGMALNHLAGIELTPTEEILPAQLITSENATEEIAKTANEYDLPSDYREQFKKLWGVG